MVDRRVARLYRKTGYKHIGYERDGTTYLVFKGKEYRAASVAWFLQTGAWPLHLVVPTNGKPFDLDLRNLLPITGTNFRYVPRLEPSGDWSHNLGRSLYATEAECRHGWLLARQAFYSPAAESIKSLDQRATLQYQMDIGVVVERHKVVPAARMSAERRPTKPKVVDGKKWHWYEKRWELTDMPCHPMDDYIVRCHASRYLGAKMRFSPEHGRVIAVSTITPEQVRIHKLTCDHKFCQALPVVHG